MTERIALFEWWGQLGQVSVSDEVTLVVLIAIFSAYVVWSWSRDDDA